MDTEMSVLTRRTSRILKTILGDAPQGLLLPCLYQTRTIRRGYSTPDDVNSYNGEDVDAELRSIKKRWSTPKRCARDARELLHETARRSRQTRKAHVLPFEGTTGSANPDERFANTTMTPRELEIFEGLFRKGLGSAKSNSKEPEKHFRQRAAQEFPELLRPLAREAKELRVRASLEAHAAKAGKKKKNRKHATHINGIQDKQSEHIRKLMDEADTDLQLWRLLQENVFSKLRDLDANEPVEISKRSAIPALVLHYMAHMQKCFPGSPLGLALLPELKKIGPSAFALGATTELYNQHLQILWKQYRDVDVINDVLAEMDEKVYSFDDGTKELVEGVFEHAQAAKKGSLGPGVQALWLTDRKVRALKKLREWSKKMDAQRISAALREARSKEMEDEEGHERQSVMI